MRNTIFLITLAIIISLSVCATEQFSIVVIPDTQYLSKDHPDVFTNITTWINNSVSALNTKIVLHVGDIVDDVTGNTTQWDRANTSLSIFDGNINYSVVPGNHDNLAYFNHYFNFTRFNSSGLYGHYPSYANNNNYRLFNVSGYSFIVVGMNYCPGIDEIRWVNDTFTAYETYEKILFMHNYMDDTGTRTTQGSYHGCVFDDASGEGIFKMIVQQHTRFRMVLSGHVISDGNGRRVDVVKGTPVNQIVQNFQYPIPGMVGNEGWLRYYTFDIDNNRIQAKTYSPYLNKFNTSFENQFKLWWSI